MEQHELGNEYDLAVYRLERAKTDVKSAKILFDAAEYKGANNRAYYAIYHAITAVHALDRKAYKRHKDTLANFNKDYIRTEIFPRTMGRRISEAQEIRHHIYQELQVKEPVAFLTCGQILTEDVKSLIVRQRKIQKKRGKEHDKRSIYSDHFRENKPVRRERQGGDKRGDKEEWGSPVRDFPGGLRQPDSADCISGFLL